jgi:hypothetical protein
MSAQTFMLFLAVASALLALWIVVRFPRLNPESGRAVTVGLVAAALVFVAVPPAIGFVGVPLGGLAAIFLVALPGCTYLFVAVAWLMLYLGRAIAPYLH